MDLTNAVAVVTGAGNGIGAALSRALAARGARLVLADLDEPAVRTVAAEVGAIAVPGDVSTVEGVRALVDRARWGHGSIDVFFANAGVADSGGPEAADDLWERSWQTNVLAHVRAARELLPDWLERGSGRFVATVSAAGLLTMLGSAPYSVTKHASLAFAEWMSITYADRGVTVQALCPQGVRTDMLDNSGTAGQRLLTREALEPEQVVDEVMNALDDDRFLILPHPEVGEYYARRAADPQRWHGGMRKLQRSMERDTDR